MWFSDWCDAIASNLLEAEQSVRAALRPTEPYGPSKKQKHTPHRAKTANAAGTFRTIELAQWEARALLQAAMPQPIGASTLRGQHARMLAAVSIFSAHLLSLNDPLEAEDPKRATAAGLTMLAELRAWLEATRWHQACRRSGTRWPRQNAIIPLRRHQTDADHEQRVNAAVGEHPLIDMAARAEEGGLTPALRHGWDGPMTARKRAKARRVLSPTALQDALDLAAATSSTETPAEALARMQATAAAIATAAAPPPQPPATVEQLHPLPASKPPIAGSTTRPRKAYVA
jgi:hypothetical protein